MTEAQVKGRICAAVEKNGGVRATARAWGLSPSYVCDLRLGRRAPSAAVCRHLGLRKVNAVRYEVAS